MTPEQLDRWQSMRGPTSRWRCDSRAVMIGAVRKLRDAGNLDNNKAVMKAVDAAYPWHERAMHPYKAWLTERRILVGILEERPLPASDEAGVCEVAGDLVQLGRVDEARKLLDEQAPNRLGRKCPVCGAKVGRNCDTLAIDGELIARELLVPHHARLVGHRDAGPLFGGTP